jgi:hypothetical protein
MKNNPQSVIHELLVKMKKDEDDDEEKVEDVS